MDIRLEQVSPTFLDRNSWSNSNIWNQSITFKAHQYIQIIAPSGSGKSSLIHFLYGLKKDYNGSILYNGLPSKEMDINKLSNLRQNKVSIIFQDLRLFPDHTCLENIEIKRLLNPYHKKEMINTMAEKLGVASKLSNKAGNCSYGEQQRIAIIRSLMQPFDCLLLDEPFSHLDEANKEKAFDLIQSECRSRNASMIFADLKHNDFFKNHITYQL